MKQKLFKTMLLLCALVAGTSMSWADTVTFDASTDVTNATHTSYTTDVTTFNCGDGSTWKATGFQETQYTDLGIGKGGANYLETPEVSGTITSVAVTWSGNTSYYLALQTTTGTELEAKSNPSSSTTETFTVTGSYSQLRLVGRRSSGTSNALAKISKVVVTYTPSSGPTTYTVTYNSNGASSGSVPTDETAYSSGSEVTVKGNTGSLKKTDYTFNGWNTAANGSGDAYDAGDTFEISANTTLYAQWTPTSGTGIINFGSASGSTNVNSTSVTGDDSQGNEWTVTTAGTSSFTPNSAYAQIGSGSNPATSITFTTTLPSAVNITTFSAKFGGFSGTAGTVTLKVGDTPVGTGSLDATNDVTVSNSIAASGTVLTVTVTGISKGVKAYYISYAEGSLVDVTGVTLNKNSTTLSVGDTETLTATIAPTEATNKVVTWGSSDDAVATVVDGVVTAVAEGTATITVTTDDGGYTDNCVVTVNPAPTPAVTLDFTSNTGWSFPIAKEEGPATYNNGCYITLQGSSSNGYYFDTSSNNLLLGKSGATLTLPAFPFNVNKIKVYGTGGSGGSSSVTFNIFVGGVAVSSEATSSNEDHVFNIAADKQAAGTVYVIKVTNANNMRITRIEVFGYESVPVTAAGYATYCSSNALDFTSTDIEAYVGTIASKKLTFSPVTQVPANTGLLLVKDGGATVNVPVIASAPAVGSNCLTGVNEATTLSADDYILNVVGGKAGFYLAGEDHKNLAAHRAYIPAALGVGVKAFVFDFDDATGLERVQDVQEVQGAIYNLAGQRLSKMQKGINIVNGKKILY